MVPVRCGKMLVMEWGQSRSQAAAGCSRHAIRLPLLLLLLLWQHHPLVGSAAAATASAGMASHSGISQHNTQSMFSSCSAARAAAVQLGQLQVRAGRCAPATNHTCIHVHNLAAMIPHLCSIACCHILIQLLIDSPLVGNVDACRVARAVLVTTVRRPLQALVCAQVLREVRPPCTGACQSCEELQEVSTPVSWRLLCRKAGTAAVVKSAEAGAAACAAATMALTTSEGSMTCCHQWMVQPVAGAIGSHLRQYHRTTELRIAMTASAAG